MSGAAFTMRPELTFMTTTTLITGFAAASRQDLFFTLAVVATLATLALLVVSVRAELATKRSPSARPNRRRASAARDPREALALVGDTLAATHNPAALLPVILRATSEATGAAAGRLLRAGEEIAAVGAIPRRSEPLALELASPAELTTMLLYPPRRGFDDESRRLATWLASQASIALENAHLHHVVQRQATTDELTGLVNRRRFMAALRAEIARPSRCEQPSLILADLDDFKLVNDRFGHPVGDDLLQAFAAAMRACLRDVDVAGRLGGEEFAVLLPDTPMEAALAVAERLRLLVAAPLLVRHDVDITATASLGVAELVEGEGADELLRRADAALYRAKAAGKNTVSIAAAAA